jgi:O-antigen/teichoic acid export membrane protein
MSSASNSNSKSLLTADSGTTASKNSRKLVSDSIATGLIFALLLTVGQRIIGFGRGILFCQFMTDQELGQWSMVWSYLMLLAPLAVLGLPGCFGKYSEYYRQRGQLKSFVGRIALVSVVMTLGLATAIFIFPETFSWILFRDTENVTLVRCIAVALVFVGVSNFLSTLMESLRQVRIVTLMRFATGVSFAAAAVLFLSLFGGGAASATAGFTIASIIGSIPALWVLWHFRSSLDGDGDRLTHSSMWKRIAPFAVWLWVSNMLTNMFEVSDRYMLIHWSVTSAEAAQSSVGQYHSGRVVPLLLIGVAAMLAGVILPYMSEAWEQGRKDLAARQLNWSIKITTILFTVGGVVLLLLSPILFDWILEGRYNDGLAILPLTMVYCIWFGLHMIGQNYLWVAEKGRWATLATGIGLAVNLGLNVVLIPTIGLYGAVLATAAGNLLIVLMLFGLNHRLGCATDIGIWACAFIPLLLLASKPLACGLAIVLLAICLFTSLFFDADEKSEILAMAKKRLSRG